METFARKVLQIQLPSIYPRRLTCTFDTFMYKFSNILCVGGGRVETRFVEAAEPCKHNPYATFVHLAAYLCHILAYDRQHDAVVRHCELTRDWIGKTGVVSSRMTPMYLEEATMGIASVVTGEENEGGDHGVVVMRPGVGGTVFPTPSKTASVPRHHLVLWVPVPARKVSLPQVRTS